MYKFRSMFYKALAPVLSQSVSRNNDIHKIGDIGES